MTTPEKIRKRYDRWSRYYDAFDLGGVTKQKKMAVDILKIGHDARVLDVGSGTGAIVPYAASNLDEHGELVAMDFSEAMVEQAGRRIRKKGLEGKARAVVADATKMPFETEYFDAMLATFAFTSFPDPQHALDECYRVLRKGGRFSILDTGRPRGGLKMLRYWLLKPVMRWIGHTRIDIDVVGMARRSGFTVVTIHRFPFSIAYCALLRK